MPAPLVGAAVAAAARLAAKKVAQEAAKKAAKKAADKIANNSVKVINPMSKRDRDFKNKGADKAVKAAKSGSDVKVGEKVQKVMKPAKVVKINSAPAKSADAAKKSADAKALKAANKPTNKTGSAMSKIERNYFQGKGEMVKSMQNTERAGLSKTSRKTTKGK